MIKRNTGDIIRFKYGFGKYSGEILEVLESPISPLAYIVVPVNKKFPTDNKRCMVPETDVLTQAE